MFFNLSSKNIKWVFAVVFVFKFWNGSLFLKKFFIQFWPFLSSGLKFLHPFMNFLHFITINFFLCFRSNFHSNGLKIRLRILWLICPFCLPSWYIAEFYSWFNDKITFQKGRQLFLDSIGKLESQKCWFPLSKVYSHIQLLLLYWLFCYEIYWGLIGFSIDFAVQISFFT